MNKHAEQQRQRMCAYNYPLNEMKDCYYCSKSYRLGVGREFQKFGYAGSPASRNLSLLTHLDGPSCCWSAASSPSLAVFWSAARTWTRASNWYQCSRSSQVLWRQVCYCSRRHCWSCWTDVHDSTPLAASSVCSCPSHRLMSLRWWERFLTSSACRTHSRRGYWRPMWIC